MLDFCTREKETNTCGCNFHTINLPEVNQHTERGEKNRLQLAESSPLFVYHGLSSHIGYELTFNCYNFNGQTCGS